MSFGIGQRSVFMLDADLSLVCAKNGEAAKYVCVLHLIRQPACKVRPARCLFESERIAGTIKRISASVVLLEDSPSHEQLAHFSFESRGNTRYNTILAAHLSFFVYHKNSERLDISRSTSRIASLVRDPATLPQTNMHSLPLALDDIASAMFDNCRQRVDCGFSGPRFSAAHKCHSSHVEKNDRPKFRQPASSTPSE